MRVLSNQQGSENMSQPCLITLPDTGRSSSCQECSTPLWRVVFGVQPCRRVRSAAGPPAETFSNGIRVQHRERDGMCGRCQGSGVLADELGLAFVSLFQVEGFFAGAHRRPLLRLAQHQGFNIIEEFCGVG